MKKYIVILCMCLLGLASCDDKLDLAPANQITQEQIMELLASGDSSKIDLVLGGLASNLPYVWHRDLGGSDPLINSPLGLMYRHSLMGYDLVIEGNDMGVFGYLPYISADVIRNGLDNKNTGNWELGWKCVAEANRLLDFLTDEIVGDSKRLKTYKAQALTLRAFAYNWLMENYREAYRSDGVGLMIYDKIGGDYKPYSTAGEMYDFIKQDIKTATGLFAESQIGEAQDGYTIASFSDIDLGVANFVLARISLLTGDYVTAIAASNAVLAKYPNLIATEYYGGKNSGTATEPEFKMETNAFLNFTHNPEVIWGFQDVLGNRNNIYTAWNVLSYSYGGASAGDYTCIVNTLYDQINANDVRKSTFLDGNTRFEDYRYESETSPTNRSVPEYSNLKFAASLGKNGTKANADISSNDICYIRVSEVLLIKAEAQAKSGDDAGAKATLNTLLAARSTGSGTLTADNYGGGAGNTLEQVKLQWRIEMWGEKATEYYNNKRWGVDVVRSMTATNHGRDMTIPVAIMTLPIPENELLYNPNLR
ncbi:MAG: RagB/SusD family nutrient uptake outer membrane protein [Tannerella sp.]|nr:RagB/SusD family nutrient uptake outer membrane protein [Tannerella sp.]